MNGDPRPSLEDIIFSMTEEQAAWAFHLTGEAYYCFVERLGDATEE